MGIDAANGKQNRLLSGRVGSRTSPGSLVGHGRVGYHVSSPVLKNSSILLNTPAESPRTISVSGSDRRKVLP